MRAKEKPTESVGETAGRKTKKKYIRPYQSTRKHQKRKHWSREPRQREKDAAILALFGLGFHKTRCGAHTFTKVSVPKPELQEVGV